MKITTLLILSSTTLLCSCASMIEYAITSSPSAKAEAIKESIYPKDVETCQLLGSVSGSSIIMANKDNNDGAISINNAMVEAKEQAAKLNATHILVVTLKKPSNPDVEGFGLNMGGSEVSAKAYKCS